MLGLVSQVRDNVKTKGTTPTPDNPIFWLHYRMTVVILFGCSLIVTAQEYIGSHIQCLQDNPDDSGDIPENVINNYCFIMTTFSVPKSYGKAMGREVAHYGVGPYTDQDERKYHAYYQWVPFILFLQGTLFYIPHFLWKVWEEGKLKSVILNLNEIILKRVERREKQQSLATYFTDSLHSHNVWAYKYFLCELIFLVNIVGNIVFTDTFLGGEFSTYGFEVVRFLESDPAYRTDPMSRVFPKVTKCTFHKFGSSGTIERRDALCVLSLNIVNEKIFTFLWFWFIILAGLTVLAIIFHILVWMSSNLKVQLLKIKADPRHYYNIEEINNKCNIGDWLLLYSLGCNMERTVFGEFLNELVTSMNIQTKLKQNL